jgi:hypothetical protein
MTAKFIIIDIDNCISDDKWRMAHVSHKIEDLDERYYTYNICCHNDQPCMENINTLALLVQMGAHPVFITARPEMVRAETVDWLHKHLPFSFDAICDLMMRPVGDKRTSPELKPALLQGWIECNFTDAENGKINHFNKDWILCIFDDRQDVLDAHAANGYRVQHMAVHKDVSVDERGNPIADDPARTDVILNKMASTFKERNAVYGSNYKMVAPMVKILFPNGVPPELVVTDQWHLFELILVKLSRYAISNLTHTDSIHDAGVYSAMCESINKEQEK